MAWLAKKVLRGRLTELSGQRKLVRNSKRLLWLQAVSFCGGSACGRNAAEHRRLHCQSICASALCRCYASALAPLLFLLLKAEVHALSREVVVVRVGADPIQARWLAADNSEAVAAREETRSGRRVCMCEWLC